MTFRSVLFRSTALRGCATLPMETSGWQDSNLQDVLVPSEATYQIGLHPDKRPTPRKQSVDGMEAGTELEVHSNGRQNGQCTVYT